MLHAITVVILCSLLQRTWSDFASHLFLSITADESNNNVAIAPLTIQESLTLLYVGSDGVGARELKKYLDLTGENKSAVLDSFQIFPRSIITSEVNFESAFKFYVDIMFPIRPKFVAAANDYIQTSIERIKFNKDPELARRISDNMETMLHHEMKNIVKSAEINETTRSILLQGFYFQGNFEKPFQKMARPRKFFPQPNISISVQTYIKYDKLPLGNLVHMNCHGIEIPYRNSNLSMLILLPKPNESNTIRTLETHLANTDLRSVGKYFTESNVYVEVPHFTIDYERELTESLKRMGIKAIFDKPEFDSLTSTPFFSVTKIKHQGQFQFTCGQPKCSKTTLETLRRQDDQNITRFQFIANRPFLFAIKDAWNAYIMGRVINPK